MDPTKTPITATNLRIKHRLTWYNPFGWVWAGLFTPADLFHLQWWSLPLWPIAMTILCCMKLRRKPIVITVHNVLPHEGQGAFVPAGRWVCRFADKVLVHSEVNRAQLLEHYGLDPARVQTVPMVQRDARTALPAREDARAALGVPDDAPTVLFFGIIRPYKGVDVLIRAFAQTRAAHPEARLIIAGRPWEPWEPYEQLIEELGLGDAVILDIGYVPEENVARLYAAADAVVLPYTHFDAQSAVGAQALAHGKPLFVSDCGGLADWVDHDPAWIAPPGDVEALAGKLAALFAAPGVREEAFRPIAQRVRQRAGSEAVAEAHRVIYAALLGF